MMIELSPADLTTPRLGHGEPGDTRHTVHIGGYPSPITATATAGEIMRVAQAWNDLAAVALEREHGPADVHDPIFAIARAQAARP